MLVVHPSVPATTVKELIALAKAKPGFYSYGSSGNGSVGHLAMALFDMMAGIKTEHIAYKGTAPAVTELLGGQIPLMMSSMLSVLPHVKAGKLRLLAVTTVKRSPAVPDAPTIAEVGRARLRSDVMVRPGRCRTHARPRAGKTEQPCRENAARPRNYREAVAPGRRTYYFGPQEFAKRVRDRNSEVGEVIKDAGVRIE